MIRDILGGQESVPWSFFLVFNSDFLAIGVVFEVKVMFEIMIRGFKDTDYNSFQVQSLKVLNNIYLRN